MVIPKISAVVCTHNPRPDHLSRVLGALRAQTLPLANWEVLLVDNASTEVLERCFDLSWHPASRYVREDELGLTPARLRAIAEARGDVIVFVDDDNVLEPDYLDEAVRIGEAYPFLGAWGGSIDVEFETPPAEWVFRHRDHFAYRDFERPRWSNIKSDLESQPYGAGMCLRRVVCQTYADNVSGDSLRRSLDRRGTNLQAGGDIDLVLTSDTHDLGWGNFPSLRLVHLIPAARTQEKYMLRLREEVVMSAAIIAGLNGFGVRVMPPWRYYPQLLWRRLRYGRYVALFMAAERRGQIRGLAAVTSYASSADARSNLE